MHRRCRPGAADAGAGSTRAMPADRGRRIVLGGAGVVGRVATHERTRNTARWLARNPIIYPATGVWVLVRRCWEARTNARYERLMRAAETAGDYERLTDWEARARTSQGPAAPAPDGLDHRPAGPGPRRRGADCAGSGCCSGWARSWPSPTSDTGWLLTPLQKAVDGIAWAAWLLDALWLPAVVVVPWLVLAGLWQPGRQHGRVPRWAAPAGGREHPTVIVTPGGVATALSHLGIPALNRAVKDGWQVEFATPPVRVNGRGYQTAFSLPMGVTPEMIADKRDVLARNLVRAPLEVWPSAADRAGYVDLWVADQGSTERPAPPYPLLHDGICDVFAGIPMGVSQRGDVIAPPLPGANVAFGGVMGQGKSNAARVVMAGAAFECASLSWPHLEPE